MDVCVSDKIDSDLCNPSNNDYTEEPLSWTAHHSQKNRDKTKMNVINSILPVIKHQVNDKHGYFQYKIIYKFS